MICGIIGVYACVGVMARSRLGLSSRATKTIEAIVAGPLIANDYVALLGGVVEGLGLAQLPDLVAHTALKTGDVAQVLKPFAPTAPGLFLYYPSRHQMMPKLRAFVDQ